MKTTVIIGAGGVGNVVAHKCAQDAETFGTIWLASRTFAKCDAIAADVRAATGVEFKTAQVDADDASSTAAFIKEIKTDYLLNH